MKKENERKRRKVQDACDEDNRDSVKKKLCKENGISPKETKEAFVGSCKASKKIETPVLCNGKKVQENDCEKEHTSDGKERLAEIYNEKAKKLEHDMVKREKKSKKKERKVEGDRDVNTVDGQEVVPNMNQNSFDKKNGRGKEAADAEISDKSNEVTEKPGVHKKKKKKKRKGKIKMKKKKKLRVYENYAVHPALDYLRTWHSNREYWSFKKVRQGWLLQNLFDQEKVILRIIVICMQSYLCLVHSKLMCYL